MSGACAIPETPWVVRPFESEDEGCVVSMWLKSYSRSSDVRDWLVRRGHDRDMPLRWFQHGTSEADLAQQRYYWRFHQPMVVGLTRGCETRVLCDPERVHAEPGRPSCILAWACVSPGLVHYVAIKQEAIRTGRDIVAEMVADLLHDRLDAPVTYTFDLYELKRLHLKPENWKHDGRWLRGMHDLSLFARAHQRATDDASVIAAETMRAVEAA